MNIKTGEQFSTSAWSGGNTTELFIYPAGSSYKDRSFLFRLSSATVTDERSTFTKLPGINRILLVLEGQLRLIHNGKAGGLLLPGRQEAFPGDMDTVGEGKAVGFNLMLQGGAAGKVVPIELPGKDKENCVVYAGDSKKSFLLLYVWKGRITLADGYEKKIVKEKELAVLEMDKEDEVAGFVIENQLKTMATVIKAEIHI